MFDQLDLSLNIFKPHFEEKKRCLNFSGTRNFRDLGGYRTHDGKHVRWEVLYRSDHLHKLTDSDLGHLAALNLDKIIDFRAEHEKEEEPDRTPVNLDIQLVAIPVLDSSTEIWHVSRDNFRNIDAVKFMTETNIELATRFTPEIRQFINEVFLSNGRPLLFHCAAGKDRTGYAAAVLLRILGVPQEVVMDDYLLSNHYYLASHSLSLTILRLTKGRRFASVVKGFLEVRPGYISAAFKAMDSEFGSFEKYTRNGLGMTEKDVETLKRIYLE